MNRKGKFAIVAAVLAILIAALAGSTLVGSTMRMVDLVAMFASGFAAGAALTAVFASRSHRPASVRRWTRRHHRERPDEKAVKDSFPVLG